jgi:hypothetical protein
MELADMLPTHMTLPPARTTQTRESAATATASEIPGNVNGGASGPPTWAESPQHATVPDARRAQLWLWLVVIATASAPSSAPLSMRMPGPDGGSKVVLALADVGAEPEVDCYL